MFRNAKFSITRMCNRITNIIRSHVVQNAKRNAVQQDCRFALNMTLEINRRFRCHTFLWKLGIEYAGGAQQFSVYEHKFCCGSLLQCLILVLRLLEKCDAQNKDSECQ
jgi:hypothetical protein